MSSPVNVAVLVLLVAWKVTSERVGSGMYRLSCRCSCGCVACWMRICGFSCLLRQCSPLFLGIPSTGSFPRPWRGMVRSTYSLILERLL